jgi:hypothetical protein
MRRQGAPDPGAAESGRGYAANAIGYRSTGALAILAQGFAPSPPRQVAEGRASRQHRPPTAYATGEAWVQPDGRGRSRHGLVRGCELEPQGSARGAQRLVGRRRSRARSRRFRHRIRSKEANLRRWALQQVRLGSERWSTRLIIVLSVVRTHPPPPHLDSIRFRPFHLDARVFTVSMHELSPCVVVLPFGQESCRRVVGR